MNRNFLVTGGAQGIGLAYCRFVTRTQSVISIDLCYNCNVCKTKSKTPSPKEISVLRTILTGGGNVFFTDINEEQVLVK